MRRRGYPLSLLAEFVPVPIGSMTAARSLSWTDVEGGTEGQQHRCCPVAKTNFGWLALKHPVASNYEIILGWAAYC